MISIGTLMNTLDGGIISVTFPAIASDFDIDPSTVLWTTVGFWVVSVGLVMTMGWLGDVAGHRRVFTIGSLVFSLGLLLSGIAPNIWFLIGSRIVQGLGAAMTLSTINALITRTFPTHERGKAMGVSGAVVGLGLTSGPLLGGLVMDLLDWRALFYLRAPLGLVGAWLALALLPSDGTTGGRFRVDLLGAGALFATLASFLLFINRGGVAGYGSPIVIAFGVATLFFLPGLLWAERRSVRPIVDASLLKTRDYAVAVAAMLGHYMSYGPVIIVAPFFFVDGMGFSAARLGVYIGAVSLARTFLAPLTGRMSDRFGPKVFLVLGSLIAAVALLWLSLLGIESSQLAMLASLLLVGVGSALFEPVVTSVIMGSVPEERLGTASASVAMARQVAFAVGVALAGAVFAVRERVYLETDTAPEALANAFSDTLIAGLLFAVTASAIALFVRRPRARRVSPSTGQK